MSKLCVVISLLFVQVSWAFECPGNQIVVAGLNKHWVTHARVTRKFFAEFPDVPAGTPVGVIFGWHGVGDKIENWRSAFPLAIYSSEKFPFIVITPEEMGLTPLSHRQGMGWDLFGSVSGDQNMEAMLFESVLGCLERSHNIAKGRVYTAGFSAGAMVSNMLHARYPDIVGAVFSSSGIWLNDSVQRDMVKIPLGMRIKMEWTPLNPSHHGAVLMTHGSDDDIYKLGPFKILDFRASGLRAASVLPKLGRTVVTCPHDGGHQLNALIMAEEAVRFFALHEAGKPSPFLATGMPRFLSSVCSLVRP